MRGVADPTKLEKGQEVRIMPSGYVHRLKYKPKPHGPFRYLFTFVCDAMTDNQVTLSFPPGARRCPRCTP